MTLAEAFAVSEGAAVPLTHLQEGKQASRGWLRFEVRQGRRLHERQVIGGDGEQVRVRGRRVCAGDQSGACATAQKPQE